MFWDIIVFEYLLFWFFFKHCFCRISHIFRTIAPRILSSWHCNVILLTHLPSISLYLGITILFWLNFISVASILLGTYKILLWLLSSNISFSVLTKPSWHCWKCASLLLVVFQLVLLLLARVAIFRQGEEFVVKKSSIQINVTCLCKYLTHFCWQCSNISGSMIFQPVQDLFV